MNVRLNIALNKIQKRLIALAWGVNFRIFSEIMGRKALRAILAITEWGGDIPAPILLRCVFRWNLFSAAGPKKEERRKKKEERI